MRGFIVEDRTYRLTEKQYKILLARTDVANAKLVKNIGNTSYEIGIRCICPEGVSATDSCKRCSLGPDYINCIDILDAVKLRPWAAGLCKAVVSWLPDDDSKARRELRKLRKALLTLPKVRR